MLSVVICTYNEEKNLERAVKSVKSFADEIVVVDTQSIDKTVDLAKKLGCKVFRHKNTGIIEPMRNFAVSKARGDWILLLDADEEVSGDLAHEISKIKDHPKADYYRIPRQNIIFGKWIKSDHWWPDYTYRLFKKGAVIWQDEIHSLPQIKGKGIDLENFIIHHNYQTVSQYLKKLDTYTDFQAQELTNKNTKFTPTDLLAKPFSEFLSQYFARHAVSSGLHGLILSILQAFSVFVVMLKLWEHQKFPEYDFKLDQELLPLQKELKWWQTEYQIRSTNPISALFLKFKRKIL